MTEPKLCKRSNFPIFSTFGAALGSLLVGFHIAIIAAPLPLLQETFGLNAVQQGWVVSLFLIGAALGSIVGGWLLDRIGRKKSLLLTTFLFFIGALFLTSATSLSGIFLGRCITGLSAGIALVGVPLYIAEIASPQHRGALGSFTQLFIAFGILIAYLISFYYVVDGNWRSMFRFGVFLALFQCGCTLLLSESPCWSSGHRKKASLSWKECFGSYYRIPLVIGVSLSGFQQITGINTVFYYAPRILEAGSHLTLQQVLVFSLIFSSINALVTFLGLWLVDWAGRRLLLLIGYAGLVASLLLLVFSLHLGGILPLIAIISFISFFACNVGSCTWLVLSEIFPEAIRGRAMGLSLFVNWVANTLVAFTFPSLIDRFGVAFTFLCYALFSLLAFWFVWKSVPETKRKTLDEIQNFWKTTLETTHFWKKE